MSKTLSKKRIIIVTSEARRPSEALRGRRVASGGVFRDLKASSLVPSQPFVPSLGRGGTGGPVRERGTSSGPSKPEWGNRAR